MRARFAEDNPLKQTPPKNRLHAMAHVSSLRRSAPPVVVHKRVPAITLTNPLLPFSLPFHMKNLGSISFIHIPSRSIMIGDASKNHAFLSKQPGLSYPLSTGTCQMGTAIKSMDKIISLKDQIDTIFPAHDYNHEGVTVEEMKAFRTANPRS